MVTYARAGQYGPATVSGAPVGALLQVFDAAGTTPATLFTDASKNKSTSPYLVSDGAGVVQLKTAINARARRGTTLAKWARSQTGVYTVDVLPAFTDPAVVSSDGVHPTTGAGSGSQLWADTVFDALFPGI